LAAFQLSRYPLAEHYLQAAVKTDPGDMPSAERLKATEMVLRMDPFQRKISVAQRDKIVVEDFLTAGERLKSCGVARGVSLPSASQSSLSENWARLRPTISLGDLRRDPDLVESAMNLVFEIERQTSSTCGTPTGADLALLLIARLHEGN
jgi:hypothetical protein